MGQDENKVLLELNDANKQATLVKISGAIIWRGWRCSLRGGRWESGENWENLLPVSLSLLCRLVYCVSPFSLLLPRRHLIQCKRSVDHLSNFSSRIGSLIYLRLGSLNGLFFTLTSFLGCLR